jgi:Flp pilus assembly pilin Flp
MADTRHKKTTAGQGDRQMRSARREAGVTTLEYIVLAAVLVLGLVVGVQAFKSRVGQSLDAEGRAAVEVASGRIGPVAARYGDSAGPGGPAQAAAAAEPERAVLAAAPAPPAEESHGFGIRDGVSLGVGFIPLVGTGQSVVELFSGRDYITGQPANRWVAAIGVVAGLVPGGKAAVKATAAGVEMTARAAKTTSRAADALATAGRGVVRHGPMNPGPLPTAIANTFRAGSYTSKVLDEPVTLYRVYGGEAGELGKYWTRTKPSGPLQSRMDLALDPAWGNTATQVTTIKVPKGTTIFEGAAERQGNLLGGGNQIVIPKVDPSWIVK